MKKIIKKICFGLLCFISILGFTYAQEEVFLLDWKTDNITGTSQEMLYNDNVAYKGGFVTSRLDFNNNFPKTILIKYNNAGEKTREVNYTSNAIIRLQNYNNQLYALTITENDEIEILKLDDNLSITSRKVIGTDINDMEFTLISKMYGIDAISFDDEGNMYIFTSDTIIKLDSNLKTEEELEQTEANMKKYFPILGELFTSEDSDKMYIGMDTKNNLTVYAGAKINSYTAAPHILTEGLMGIYEPDTTAIMKLEEDGQELWAKEYEEYSVILTPKIISNYIVAIGMYKNQETEVIILDKEGNIIQTIEEATMYLNISAGNTNFMVNAIQESQSTLCGISDGGDENEDEEDDDSPQGPPPLAQQQSTQTSCFDYNQAVYYLPLNIVTKVDGNGKIEVIETARDGENVTFKVTPEKGYVLGVVKVTDADGNVLKFTSNTFTMPSSDVTIEATFIPENPDTNDLKIIALSLFLIVGSIIGFINFKRLKWLD